MLEILFAIHNDIRGRGGSVWDAELQRCGYLSRGLWSTLVPNDGGMCPIHARTRDVLTDDEDSTAVLKLCKNGIACYMNGQHVKLYLTLVYFRHFFDLIKWDDWEKQWKIPLYTKPPNFWGLWISQMFDGSSCWNWKPGRRTSCYTGTDGVDA